MKQTTKASPSVTPQPERDIRTITNWSVEVDLSRAGAGHVHLDTLVDRVKTLDRLDCDLQVDVSETTKYVRNYGFQSGETVPVTTVVFRAVRRAGPQPA